MKEILTQYAAYNIWANQRLCDVVLSLSDEQQQQDLQNSFPSLHKTILHLWDAENMWWQRLKLVEQAVRPSTLADYSVNETISNLLNQNRQWLEWITTATDAAVDHVFSYQNTKKEQFKQPVYQMLLHLFNHGTYHRGQLVTMFHQLGVTKIPSTDFIEFTRRK